jgi:uracil-DNA glycosylase
MITEIEKLNHKIKECRKCRLSETRINALCGEGDINSRVILIAQAPGENEDRDGKMFIGPSGKVLDELLEKAGVSREEIYMTNLIKCMLPGYRKPKQDEIEICSRYLEREIEIIEPAVLIPLGYYATKYIFSRYSIPVPVKSEFNNVYTSGFLLNGKKVFPLQHPASILHNNSIRGKVTKNYRKLKVLLTDCKWYHACPMKRYHESGMLDKKWVELYCKGNWESCVRYRMEERGEEHPDCMLPDGTIDKKLCL